MSTRSRYRRTFDQRRRLGAPAARVGMVAGGAIAAALVSAAITPAAHADGVGAATTVTDANPFADLFGSNPLTNTLDTALVTAFPTFAQNLDIVQDGDLQVFANVVTNDLDPFEDMLPADPTTLQIIEAAGSDSVLAEIPGFGGIVPTLDSQIDAGTTATPPAVDTDPDLFEDMLGPNATAAQLGIATAADNTLDAYANAHPGVYDLPFQLSQADAQFDSLTLPTGDADPFEDLLPANATFAQITEAWADDRDLDIASPTLAASLDAQVDQALASDNDAAADLAQAFGPNGGAFIEFFVQQFVGSSPALQDATVDALIASMGLGPF